MDKNIKIIIFGTGSSAEFILKIIKNILKI